MREIVLDTETTGLDPKQGDRIIEIACIEIEKHRKLGRHFQVYINPQREVHPQAQAVHGISTQFLKDKPLFSQVVDEFLQFVDGARLIIHNAPFDVGFLNHELSLLGGDYLPIHSYCQITDTLEMARQEHPGERNSLDALCKRYDVDNSKRDLHGALVDAELLAQVYLAMRGGQAQLFETNFLEDEQLVDDNLSLDQLQHVKTEEIILYASESETALHKAYLQTLKKAHNNQKVIWDVLDNASEPEKSV
jgi:DNA polymerase III subunit epsilon